MEKGSLVGNPTNDFPLILHSCVSPSEEPMSQVCARLSDRQQEEEKDCAFSLEGRKGERKRLFSREETGKHPTSGETGISDPLEKKGKVERFTGR